MVDSSEAVCWHGTKVVELPTEKITGTALCHLEHGWEVGAGEERTGMTEKETVV